MQVADLDALLEPWDHLHGSAPEFERVWHEVEEKQTQSLSAKRRLADDTKDFKRLPDPERLNSIPDLLKAYQGEIDSLSKRAKFAEAGLAEMLRAVRVLPEPSVVKARLAAALASQGQEHADFQEQLAQKDIQIAKLKDAVSDLESELSTVTNQAATVRRLERQLKEQEAAAEAKAEEARRLKDEEWERRVEDLRQVLAQMVQDRERHEQEIERLQQLHAEVSLQLAQERDVREAELERLRQQHLEEQRWAEEAALARATEAELARQRLRATESEDNAGSVQVLQNLLDGAQQRTACLEKEAADLRAQVAKVSDLSEQRKDELRQQQCQFDALLEAKDTELHALREQLSLRPSLEEVVELRQQLRNVKTVELADESGASTDLERRLLQKQRALESQLSEARVRADQSLQDNEGLKTRVQVAEDEAKDLRHLVGRLEAQLTGPASAAAAELVVPLAQLLPLSGGTSSSADTSAAAGGQAMPSMLEIVTGQRDRLRLRAGELEQERDNWRAIAEQERKRGEQLHADNVKLLERSRYLQSLQPKQGGRGRARGKAGSADADLEGRYSAAYEDNLNAPNPFDQFREEEKALRVANMHGGDRLLVLVGSLLMSSKVARTFTLGYTLALHLLVFLVLARLSHRSA